MSEHVIEWLNAHLDGELKGRKLQRVQEHLAECDACRAELESLQGLSALLQEAPAAEFASQERFVSQVNLRLPERRTKQTRGRLIEAGWWMAPVGLLMAWIFISTAVLVSDAVTAAHNLGCWTLRAPCWPRTPLTAPCGHPGWGSSVCSRARACAWQRQPRALQGTYYRNSSGRFRSRFCTWHGLRSGGRAKGVGSRYRSSKAEAGSRHGKKRKRKSVRNKEKPRRIEWIPSKSSNVHGTSCGAIVLCGYLA
jgi:hypothetical protein